MRRLYDVQQRVDLYDSAYHNYNASTYEQVRTETYGQDYGQTSWVTSRESEEIPQLLALNADSFVLEVGCGSGGYALHLAETLGCRILGLDINAAGVRNANRLAAVRNLEGLVRFEQRDVSTSLPVADGTFDAVFSNDVLCHLPRRAEVLREILRVIKKGGRFLFSDALVIAGLVTHEEIATRSSIGFYVYSSPGENERLIEQAGFRLMHAIDTTESASLIARRWHDSRVKREKELIAIEGDANFQGLQRFLAVVAVLTTERRLRRYLYVAAKEQ